MKLNAVVVQVETTPHLHKLRLRDDDDTEFDAIMWNGCPPQPKQKLEVRGTWKTWHGEQQFQIDSWRRILKPSERGQLHELLGYARAYLSKEAAPQQFDPRGITTSSCAKLEWLFSRPRA